MTEPERYAPRGNIVWALQYDPDEPLVMLNWLLRSKILMFDHGDDFDEWPDQGVSITTDNEVVVVSAGGNKYLQRGDWVTLDITGDDPKINFFGNVLFQTRYNNVSLPSSFPNAYSEHGVLL
jgi:hypothetical protein